MTLEQKRLLHPLINQTSTQKAVNLAAVISLAWPFSISRIWFLVYCETFSARLDPLSLHTAYGQAARAQQTAMPAVLRGL